jgi:hypothetical protein
MGVEGGQRYNRIVGNDECRIQNDKGTRRRFILTAERAAAASGKTKSAGGFGHTRAGRGLFVQPRLNSFSSSVPREVAELRSFKLVGAQSVQDLGLSPQVWKSPSFPAPQTRMPLRNVRGPVPGSGLATAPSPLVSSLRRNGFPL